MPRLLEEHLGEEHGVATPDTALVEDVQRRRGDTSRASVPNASEPRGNVALGGEERRFRLHDARNVHRRELASELSNDFGARADVAEEQSGLALDNLRDVNVWEGVSEGDDLGGDVLEG